MQSTVDEMQSTMESRMSTIESRAIAADNSAEITALSSRLTDAVAAADQRSDKEIIHARAERDRFASLRR